MKNLENIRVFSVNRNFNPEESSTATLTLNENGVIVFQVHLDYSQVNQKITFVCPEVQAGDGLCWQDQMRYADELLTWFDNEFFGI